MIDDLDSLGSVLDVALDIYTRAGHLSQATQSQRKPSMSHK